MSTSVLSFLSMICIFIDQAGLAFFQEAPILRMIGRIAFPLCCFLLVLEIRTRGLTTTSSLMLLGTALLSELPFNLLHFSRLLYWGEQNPIFSMVISALLISVLLDTRITSYLRIFFALSLILFSMIVNVCYGWLGPIYCAGFVWAKDSRSKRFLIAVVLPYVYALTLLLSGIPVSWVRISLWASLASIPICLCNTQREAPPAALFMPLFSYPLMLLSLLILRNLHIIPPYFISSFMILRDIPLNTP